jgi:hypothetical protein
VTDVAFSSVTGETRIESPKKYCRSMPKVDVSVGYLNQSGLRTGDPSM